MEFSTFAKRAPFAEISPGSPNTRRFTQSYFCVVAGRGGGRQTHPKRGVSKLNKSETKKTGKKNKTTTFLEPVGRFCPEAKTAAKTLLKPYVLKLKKKETPEIKITIGKNDQEKKKKT